MRIHAGPQSHGIGEDEIAEVFLGEDPVFHALVGFDKDLHHIRDVKVADVRTENGVEPRPKGIHMVVERPGIQRVIGFTAKVEMWHEEVANIFGPRNTTAGKVVQLFWVLCGEAVAGRGWQFLYLLI